MNPTRVALTGSVFLNVTLLFFAGVLSQAIVPKRRQLIYDALNWMNFRKDGIRQLSTNLTRFRGWIIDQYNTYEGYRGFFVAYQEGVIPKMNLQQGASCNPDHLKYKNPFNNMVTWGGIKNFTLFSYENRHDTSISYCDFRLGLVCNTVSRKCECGSVGAVMSPIEPGSSVKHCLLPAGEICALPDLEHYIGYHQMFDEYFIRYLIWNPEKPESCQIGSQCRLINSAKVVFRCYDTQTHASEWYTDDEDTEIGSPCSLGYNLKSRFGSQCSETWGGWNGQGAPQDLVCYDFGPPRDGSVPPGKIHREGFCAHPAGSYQIRAHDYDPGYNPAEYYDLWNGNFIMGFVNRRTVPFDHERLERYYFGYMYEVHDAVIASSNSFLSQNVGDRCRVSQTDEFLKIWNYYAGLIQDPPPGSLFVPSATETELNAKLKDMINLVKASDPSDWKFCKVYWSYSKGKPLPPLRCEPYRPGEPTGRCVKIDDNSTRPFADHVQQLGEHMVQATVTGAGNWEDDALTKANKQIWESESKGKTSQLQGTLGKGKPCNYDLEQGMRKLIGGSSGSFYSWDQLTQFSYCDRTRLLTCSNTGVCVCYENTQTRSVTVEGTRYESDYCYAESGSCNNVGRFKWEEYYWSKKETDGIVNHYGISEAGQQGCKGGNLCLFVDESKEECTKKNTQTTGHDLGPDNSTDTGGGLGNLTPPAGKGKGTGHLEKSGATTIIILLTIAKLALLN